MTGPALLRADANPCQLRGYHGFDYSITQSHHRFPEFLQARVYGETRIQDRLNVCGADHDSIHAWLYWLLGEWGRPVDPGYLVRREAQRSFDLYVAALNETRGVIL